MTQVQSTLTFKDLVTLRQFLEKGFREDFFNIHELPDAQMLHTKLYTIIQELSELSEKNSTSHIE